MHIDSKWKAYVAGSRFSSYSHNEDDVGVDVLRREERVIESKLENQLLSYIRRPAKRAFLAPCQEIESCSPSQRSWQTNLDQDRAIQRLC